MTLLCGTGAATAFVLRDRPIDTILTIAAGLLAAGMVVTLVGVEAGAAAVAGIGTVVAGVGFGAAPRRVRDAGANRGELFAVAYVISYLAFSLPDRLRTALLDAMPAYERRRLHSRACDVLAHTAGGTPSTPPPATPSPSAIRCAPSPPPSPPCVPTAARQALDVAVGDPLRAVAAALAPELALEIVEDLAAVHLAQGRPDLAEEHLAEAARIARDPLEQAAISGSLARLRRSGRSTRTRTASSSRSTSRLEARPTCAGSPTR